MIAREDASYWIMRLRTIAAPVAALCTMALAGCASGGPPLTDMQAEELIDYGLERMEAGDTRNAMAALERFVFSFPGHQRRQEARYQLGVVYFMRQQYISAANEFDRLASDYPAGPYADDAQFKICESYYMLSPEPQLDQEYTQDGIQSCDAVVRYAPDSPHVPEAARMRDELIDKLATKQYLIAQTYMRLQGFPSAIIYLEGLLRQFPQSEVVPKALYALYQAYGKVDDNEGVNRVRQRLLEEYPDSEEARRVRRTQTDAAS